MLGGDRAFGLALREIAYAHERTAFFRRHLDQAGLSPGDVHTPADLRWIPPTEKRHYRRNFPAGVIASGHSLDDRTLHRVNSSGTTGERLTTVEHGWIYLARASKCLDVCPGLAAAMIQYPRRHVRYAAPACSDVECANPQSTMEDRVLADGTLVLSVYHDMLTTPETMLAANLEEIAEYRPQMYYADPTHLAFLSRYMDRRGFAPPKVPIFASYTLVTRVARRQVARTFGDDVPLVEVFAMSELGWIAAECAAGGLHLNTDGFFMELVCGGRSAEPGELAELLVTTLDRGCIPRIRYRTGDVFRLIDAPCPCGSARPLVRSEGRLRNFLLRGGKPALSPRGVDDVVGDAAWLDLYKLVQRDRDDFALHFIANDGYHEGAEDPIRDALRAALGDGANLRVERAGYIPTERSGKFLSCTSPASERLVEDEGLTL